jgi:hypothetical protein
MAASTGSTQSFDSKKNQRLIRSLIETSAMELGSLAVSRLVSRMREAFHPERPSHMNGYDTTERDFFPPHA